jgi:CRISPR system Cascade subunit CasE
LAEQQRAWLDRKAAGSGFLVREVMQAQEGPCELRRRGSQPIRLYGVLFDGILEVLETEAFRDVICAGIGPGKAFGFGLLSVRLLEGSL